MSDTITLRLRLSAEDVRALEARLQQAGSKGIDVKVRPSGTEPFKREIDYAEGSVGRLRQRMSELNKEIEHLGDSDAIAEKQKEIRALESQMGSLLGKTRAAAAGGAAAGGAGSAAGTAASAGLLAGMLPKVTGIGVAVAGVTALGVALADGAKKAIELDTEVRNIGSLGVQNFERFGAISKDLSTRIPQTAAEIAKGTYQAISAGISDTQATRFVETAAKAGVAGLSTTETAVNALSSVINAYKLEASQASLVSDQMFTAVKLGKTTFEEINAAIANVVPVAASAGVGFDQVSAGIATMTKQGIPTAQASTQMRQAIVELLKPGEDLAKMMEKAGIANGAMALKTLGLQGTLQKLQVATSENGKTMTQVFSSVEAGSAALALTGENAAMAASDLDAMGSAAGAMGKAFEINSKSAANQMRLLENNFDVVKMSIAETFGPAANWVLENFAGGLAKINEAFASAEGRMERIRQRGQEAFQDETQRQLTKDRAEAARMLGLVNSAELDNIEITEKMVRGLAVAKGATNEQVKGLAEYYKTLQKTVTPGTTDLNSGAPPSPKKGRGENVALQLALEQLRAEEELAMLRAKAAHKSEEEMLALKLTFLQRQLAVQQTHGDKAVSIAKTQHEIAKTQLMITLAEMNKPVAGSLDDLNRRYRDLTERINGTSPNSPLFAQLILQAEELKQQLDEVKKQASDPIYSILPGFKGFVNVDEKQLQEKLANSLKLDEDEAKKLVEEYKALGETIGSSVSSNLSDAFRGDKSLAHALRNIYRSILAETFEFIIRKALLTQVSAMLEELATKGIGGLITGGIILGVIQGMTGAAKSAIAGYATGGVIVGENGPEIIAPASDFSAFAGVIVAGALEAFRVALSRLDDADREQRQSAVDVGFDGPIIFEQRGPDLLAVVQLQQYRNTRATLGGL
jgi:TP901 family phage tail tape measure protein